MAEPKGQPAQALAAAAAATGADANANVSVRKEENAPAADPADAVTACGVSDTWRGEQPSFGLVLTRVAKPQADSPEPAALLRLLLSARATPFRAQPSPPLPYASGLGSGLQRLELFRLAGVDLLRAALCLPLLPSLASLDVVDCCLHARCLCEHSLSGSDGSEPLDTATASAVALGDPTATATAQTLVRTGWSALCRAVRVHPTLQSLSLERCVDLVGHGAWDTFVRDVMLVRRAPASATAASAASANSTPPPCGLTALAVRHCGLTSQALELFCAVIAGGGGPPKLQSLDLTGNKVLGARGAVVLSAQMNKLAHLQTLVLSGCSVDCTGTAALCYALAFNASVSHLDLSSGLVGKRGFGAVVELLTLNRTLTHINLRRNLTGASAVASELQRALSVNRTVKVLYTQSAMPYAASWGADASAVELALLRSNHPALLHADVRSKIAFAHLQRNRNADADARDILWRKCLAIALARAHRDIDAAERARGAAAANAVAAATGRRVPPAAPWSLCGFARIEALITPLLQPHPHLLVRGCRIARVRESAAAQFPDTRPWARLDPDDVCRTMLFCVHVYGTRYQQRERERAEAAAKQTASGSGSASANGTTLTAGGKPAAPPAQFAAAILAMAAGGGAAAKR